jgi:hypothetical protein
MDRCSVVHQQSWQGGVYVRRDLLWRQYLPIKHTFGIYSLELGIPEPVLSDVRRLRATRLFDRVEIWARKDPDPMAVGIVAPEDGRTRYYSIARWGDAEITLDEVKRKLRLQEMVSRAILTTATLLVMISIFLVFSA